ncbi:CoA ester lyase [Alcaligenaceae bacterium]|nr:CoA ester lyase [Alcaligenaceae bacterium]
MIFRSLLFVPGDSERKLVKGALSGADALVLDLEDAVDIARLPLARQMVHDYLLNRDQGTQEVWVRVNPLDSGLALDDLAAVVRGRPDGILLPKGSGAQDIQLLDHYLGALEVRDGIAPGSVAIMPVATETPAALFSLGNYKNCSTRLKALTWGAEDLAAAIGASTNRLANGEYEFTYQLARSLCLLGARAAGLPAIDTIWGNFKDTTGLQNDATLARKAGFSGKIAIHPDQVPIINQAFTPDEAELQHARQIVQAFENAQGAGTVQLNGEMLDRPHLKQAQQILAMQHRS